MRGRKFSGDLKAEAVRLVNYEEDQELIRGINSPTNGGVTVGGVAVAQAARDPDVTPIWLRRVLRRWAGWRA